MSKNTALYVLFGPELYNLEQASAGIQQSLTDYDKQRIDLYALADWEHLICSANSYCLLATNVLIIAHLHKASVEVNAQKILLKYLADPNWRTTIILIAKASNKKNLNWLAKAPHSSMQEFKPLTEAQFANWLREECKRLALAVNPAAFKLMQQYTTGNMFAASQLLAKLTLLHNATTPITPEAILPHLNDSAQYQTYALTDACLTADSTKAIQFLRFAQGNQSEGLLMLWHLTQYIRQLINLNFAKQQNKIAEWASQERIWPQQVPLYQQRLTHLPLPYLYELLKFCQQIDINCKTGRGLGIWHQLEQLTLSLNAAA